MSPYDWSYMQKQKKKTLKQRIEAIELRILSLDEGQEAHGEWHENNRVEDLIPIINEMQGQRPYTAMRSTGEFCECRFKGVPQGNKCGHCQRLRKPTQEDMREKIAKMICEWENVSINKWEDLQVMMQTPYFIKADKIIKIFNEKH